MTYPRELSSEPSAYEMLKMMTIPCYDGSITYFHMLDATGFLPIQYQKDSNEREKSLTGWKIAACETLFRTWDEVVEYWPIHNSNMLSARNN